MARIEGRTTAPSRIAAAPARLLGAVAVAAVVLAVAIAPTGRVRAQQPQPGAPSLTITQVDASKYPDLTAVVTVADPNGVPTLNATQFHASDDSDLKNTIRVTSAASAQDPNSALHVVLAIDTSGSMADNGKLANAQRAAVAFVNGLKPSDTVSLVSFAGDVRTLTTPGASHPDVIAAINALTANGATALYQAVNNAIFAAANNSAQRKAVVLLTDGNNDPPNDGLRAATMKTAAADGIPVFTIAFGADADTAFLRSLSDATHAQSYAADTTNVADVYAAIGRLLQAQYTLQLKATAQSDGKPGTLRISADVPGTQPATFAFTRGTKPVAPPATAAPPPATNTTTTKKSGGSSAMIVVLVAIAVIAVVAFLAFLLIRRMRATRLRRENEAMAGRQSDEPVPEPRLEPLPDDPVDHTRGRIVELNGDAPGRAFEFGTVPLRIGSAPRCDVRLQQAADVAPEHAMVWAKGGKLMLRHVGGPRRRTFVASKPVDWVILDDGDEFAVGQHRYRAERVSAPVRTPAP